MVPDASIRVNTTDFHQTPQRGILLKKKVCASLSIAFNLFKSLAIFGRRQTENIFSHFLHLNRL